MQYRPRSFRAFSLSVLLSLAIVAASPLFAAREAANGQGKWPAVAEQLKRDHVVPGSALEKLIRANQDTSVLGPFEEEGDGIGLPVWLRVLWKKGHPESRGVESEDPLGGYPLVLREAREWLLNHQDLKPEPNAPRKKKPGAPGKLSVESLSEKRISGASALHRSESDIRVFYGNPSRIVAGCNNNTTTGHQTQMYSSDSGANWTQTSLNLVNTDSFHSDPAVDWTSNGTAWTTTIGVDTSVPGWALRVRAYSSTSPGTAWTFDGTPSAAQTNADKELIWVDHSSTSAYRDTVYAIWHAGVPTFVSRRTGGAWSAPLQISAAETTGNSLGSDIKTNSSGDVYAFWPSSGNRRIYVAKSTNGGAGFGAIGTIPIATTVGSLQVGIPASNARQPVIYVSGGAFRDTSRDLAYAVWMDLNQTGCTAPGTNAASTCKTRIWFSRSTNGGAGWSAPVMINNQVSLNDQFNPWLVVDEKTGGLTVIYYDTVRDPNRLSTDVWAQYSGNDGVSWSSAVRVTSAQTFEPASYPAPDTYTSQYGDYNGLSGIAGTVYPSWTDRRNGSVEEIWSAKLINPNLEGYHDGASCQGFWGWAWDRNSPNSTVNVDLFNGASLLGTTAANFFRQDLLNAGIGNGSHGFNFTAPASLWDGSAHSITARHSGTNLNLNSTPRSITCTTIFTTQTPANSLAGSNYENATIFTSSVSGYIVALRYYKVSGEGGTHVGNLWNDTSGPALASVTFTNETASGWQTQFLPTPFFITANTRYRVSYGFNNILAKTDCGLSSPISHGPLTAVGGAYATPNGSFPNTGSCSNFFADVIFQQ